MAVNLHTSKRNNRVRNGKQSIHAARLSRRRLKLVGPAKPLWPDRSKPETFAEALDLQMRRHGENSDKLWRAIIRDGETLDPSTISAWRRGVKSPRFAQSFIYVERIEQRYALDAGYFRALLPHKGRATCFPGLRSVTTAEQRRLAWHLPTDFASRPPRERAEILEWVRRVVVSGATDYRCFQAEAIKHPYGLRFGARSPDNEGVASHPLAAPPTITRELGSLIEFKTSTLAPANLQRRGVWGPETAAQKIEHLSLFFGALAACPNGPIRGRGVPPDKLCLALLVLPPIWDWYIRWRADRRGFFTAWEVDMLSLLMGLTAPETGWLRQTPSLADALTPIEGIVTAPEIKALRDNWGEACTTVRAHAHRRIKELERVLRVHRDPFEPILPVLEAASPLGEYKKIADEILRLTPCGRVHPRAAAEALRSLLMVRLGLHLGVRQKNLRQLLVKARGAQTSSERRLEDLKCGELRWSDRDNGWEVFIPSVSFKNAGSSFFSGKPFRLLLPDLCGLYEHIDRYLSEARPLLLARAPDPETFFVKTVKRSSKNAAYSQTTFYEAWRWITQRYGIYNPYTKRGAIAGLLPHGPHNVRDVLATHILKQTGSFEQASYAIQDTPEIVAKHYGRFLPENKAHLAAQVLNRVWGST
jgi:hypothetical protein